MALAAAEHVSEERYFNMLKNAFLDGYMSLSKQSALNRCYSVLEGYARGEAKEAPDNLKNLKTARARIGEMLKSGELK